MTTVCSDPAGADFGNPKETLFEAAFGKQLGGKLPVAANDHERWLRSVALAARGHYAAARAGVSRVRSSDPALQSLVLSARASWLRQLGWHAAAAPLDGRALVAALAAGSADAQCDAYTGLAADALGQGRFGVSDAALGKCRTVLDCRDCSDLWRQRLRFEWVSAELCMARGEVESAVDHAANARERALAGPSIRHRVKSDLLVAAAAACAADLDTSVAVASQTRSLCRTNGFVPLEWASTMLLAGITSDPQEAAHAADCAATIARRGGVFRSVDT